MPTDYDKIRAENIARYGWDTAVLELLGQLYSDRTHFIFELIQNAEDAAATELIFGLSSDRLVVRHNGRPFDAADVRAICGVSQGTKADDLTQVGKFGIGFKSVYAYTNTPVIHSGNEHFAIESYVRPRAVDPPSSRRSGLDPGLEPETVFTFAFDRSEVPAPVAAREIADALGNLHPETLMFLRSIARIRVRGFGVAETLLGRAMMPNRGLGRDLVVSAESGGRRRVQEWLVWSKDLGALGEPGLEVEIAFSVRSEVDARRLVPRPSSPLVVSFPTEKETFLGFLIQGPYRTTPARDNVPDHDAWNQGLVRETAALLDDVLVELRDQELLSVDILQALPLDPARFPPASMFHPLFTTVRDAFFQRPFIPASTGGYRTAADIRLASAPGLRELLAPAQLGELCGAPGPVEFTHESVTPAGTPLLWRYLRDEIGIEEVTPGAVVAALTSEFLAAQTDSWIARLYRFLDQDQALWRPPAPPDTEPGPARTKPIIRLQDGSHVLPFDARGRPTAYVTGQAGSGPGPGGLGSGGTDFPMVRRAVIDDPGARRFLETLGFAEPDLLAAVLDHVFPRYGDGDGDGVSGLDAAQHEADLELLARALTEVAPAGRERLLDQLALTRFLIAENAETGEQAMMRPGELYQRTRALETYFDGNPDVWFASDRYGPWLAQLRAMGVRDRVQLTARAADALGYVVTVDEFARHERGVGGFDPRAALDGLNQLLVPNRHLIAGVIETSPRLGFADAQGRRALSVIGDLATSAAWLPAGNGTFRRPVELDLADLPESFQRDDGVAAALGMTRPVVDEANRQLGFPPNFLRRLARHPDLVAATERELERRESEPPASYGQSPGR